MTPEFCGEDCGHWLPRCTYPVCVADLGFYPPSTGQSPGGGDSTSTPPEPPATHGRGAPQPGNKEQAP